MRVRPAMTALAAVLLLAAASCGADGDEPADSGAGIPAESERVGEPVDYDFTATTVDGEPFEGTSLKGAPTVLWFWAPWCPTCAAQGSDVNAAADRWGDEINLIGVGGMADSEALPEFIERTGTGGITHLSDPEGEVWERFGAISQSSYAIIDPEEGLLHTGYLDGVTLEEWIVYITD
ncbi:redoxin domain-containing protein [Glycomyces xiaoerkulensis]|uniref:redoxin domain-containing protein n=1 Tax=Glycomyces xiaoerkulensis TaxID=2038139 RepID=UPI0012FFE9A8|nr:redoxin domain-containing protein [Glycomyces xiaoerkulensis]